LIEEKGIEPEIILYLEKPPTVSVLSKIVDYLQMKPRDLLRKGEDEYKTFNLKDITLDNSIILKIMSENPKLIERPIVLSGNRAIIGRPPENVLELIK
jgi:arsenate reductase|tara:strand:- start:706 stop:999 length:294 start_codon:yes stop_codon:yes gene_type:complete